MDEIIQKIRELPRFTSPKGMLFSAHDGELVEIGAVISLLKNQASKVTYKGKLPINSSRDY